MIKLVILILAASASVIGGESCTAPESGNGTCVPIMECQTLATLVTKANRTQEEIDLLKKAACGSDGSTPKVCCQQSCYTPEGLLGNCIDVKDCPHLASKVKPLTDDVTAHLQSVRCNGATQYSVCCGPELSEYDENYCKNQNFINPPDPITECCGRDLDYDKIIKGEVAGMLQYPWLALIEHEKDGVIRLHCNGNLISSKYVLTVAHCIVGPLLTKLGTPKNVRLGEFDTSNNGKDCQDIGGFIDCTDPPVTIPIERTMLHPDIDYRTLWNDIALIRLKEYAPYTDFIRPICLPTTDVTVNPPKYLPLITAGWGAVNETVTRSPVKLQVTLRFVDNQKCQETLSSPRLSTNISDDKQLCAGGDKIKDTCKGESGAPLMYLNRDTGRYELVGLVSFGSKPCGGHNLPLVYTKVFAYTKWIQDIINLWN